MHRLSELVILVEVVESGDYSSAARRLGLTPSAVSKAIRRLEVRLGARLFERTSRKMHPTADGEILYFSAKQAVEALDEAEASISGSLQAASGTLRVHAPPTFALYQIARVVNEFRERYPQVRLDFILRNEPLDMAEHRIDLTIMTGRPPDSDLLVRKIATSRWVIVASPDYIRKRGAPQTLADLHDHDCLGYSLDQPRSGWSAVGGLEAIGSLPSNAPIAANNGSMLQALARVNCGVVRLAEYHVAADIAAGRLVRLLPGTAEEVEDVFAVYPRRLRESAKLNAFVTFMQEKFSGAEWHTNRPINRANNAEALSGQA